MSAFSSRPARMPEAAGFTLTELLIVMGVLASLIAMVMVGMIGAYDQNRARVNADLILLAGAVDEYRDSFGRVLPPGYYWDENDILTPQEGVDDIVEGITVQPAPSTEDEESSAVLFFFLTRSFELTRGNDPGMVGKSGGKRGPCLIAGNLKTDMLKDPVVLDEEFENVDVQEGEGYYGVTTWFVDPWGNPYRYIIKNDGQDYTIESAGPDGEFGDQASEQDPKRKDNISLESINR